MILSTVIDGRLYQFDSSNYHDISIPVIFDGPQPNSYQVEKATSKAYEAKGFVGDTRKGGGCNFEVISMIPHCNGTHTECIGHITDDRISIVNQLKETFVPCTVITVEPIEASEVSDAYQPSLNADDKVITKSILQAALPAASGFVKALVIRTLPNKDDKKARDYIENESPFLSMDAMEYIVSLGVEHLLVDLPSVDRTFDHGKLSAHHIFWNVDQGKNEVSENANLNKTITELIYIPDEIDDGKYVLNLQIASFVSDAAPSRPILFEVKPV